MRLAGFEIYFEDLESAKGFYRDTLGMELTGEQSGHHARFGASPFLCLERKGAESCPSRDKAVVFIEVPDLQSIFGHGSNAWANASRNSNPARRAGPPGPYSTTRTGTPYS